jgi:hypothetical protein
MYQKKVKATYNLEQMDYFNKYDSSKTFFGTLTVILALKDFALASTTSIPFTPPETA